MFFSLRDGADAVLVDKMAKNFFKFKEVCSQFDQMATSSPA